MAKSGVIMSSDGFVQFGDGPLIPATEIKVKIKPGSTSRSVASVPGPPYWFADEDEDTLPGYPWRPYLQTASSMCIPLDGISFATKEQCEDFIRDEVLKARKLDSD